MPKLPKLKIRSLLESENEIDICDLEQAKDRFAQWPASIIVVVEGQVINSHEELVQLATHDQYQDREFLNAMVLPVIEGG